MLKVVKPSEIDSVIGTDVGTSEWVTIDQERINKFADATMDHQFCLLYTSPSPRDGLLSRMPSSA